MNNKVAVHFRSKWPLYLGAVALALWIAFAAVALSTTSHAWIPDAIRLPLEKEGDSIIERRGQFGDAFGAFNALVSTFALIGLFYTVRTQQTQLSSQESLSRSSDLLIRQQQFQEQFYRAIDAYRELLADVVTIGVDNGEQLLHGRAALQVIWREQFINNIEYATAEGLRGAISRQRRAYSDEKLGSWNSYADAAEASKPLLANQLTDQDVLTECLRSFGDAWAAAYLANRFQLDSLFRAWYTAYRILETAETYQIAPDAAALYSAVFRAQLSWIEMAFLLINQSGLPGNQKFPRACYLSNKYAMFDNLDSSHDVVIATLEQVAKRIPCVAEQDSASLCADAFRTRQRIKAPSQALRT